MKLALQQQAWARPLASLMQAVQRAGWAGVVGLGLVGFAVAFEFSGNAALRAEIAQAEAAARSARQIARKPAEELKANPRERLQAFYGRFPAATTLPEVLIQLDALAQKNGVAVMRADYRESAEAGTRLTRVRVSVPLTGEYPAVRAWVGEVVASLPYVTLDALTVRREAIGRNEVQAQANFSVFLEQGR